MCGTFNNRDRRDMYASLKAMDLHEDNDEVEDTWTADEDDLEAEENQG